jgi:benzoyl-CoA 2,3-epoxidase subunit B
VPAAEGGRLLRGRPQDRRHRHPAIQKFVNFWFSQSLDLHGSEVSSNAAAYFANGLKGRAEEDKYDDDHVLAGSMYELDVPDESGLKRRKCRCATPMNEVLRDWYVGDCQAGVDRWNKRVSSATACPTASALPSASSTAVGVYAGRTSTRTAQYDLGRGVGAPQARVAADAGRQGIPASIQATPVYEPGKFANYIAPPQRGINRQPIDFEYVRTEADRLCRDIGTW